MKERDPEKLDRIVSAVRSALTDLLAHLEENGLHDWLQRYAEIERPLEAGAYGEVVELVKTNAEVALAEADRMDLVCHYLDTPPPEEMERLARGHTKFGKYQQALYRSFLLRDLCNRSLRPFLTYGVFNDPQKTIDDNKQIQAIVAGAPKPDS